MGTGIDGGLSGISVSMPSFLIKFGEFDPKTKSLFLPSLWKGLWDSMVALGVASKSCSDATAMPVLIMPTQVGALSSGYLIDRWGPKKMALCASAFMIIPSLVQAFAVNRGMMLAGKLLGGLPQGILQVSAANFISEATNVRMRGPLSSLLPLSSIGGIALGLVIGFERIPYVHSGEWDSSPPPHLSQRLMRPWRHRLAILAYRASDAGRTPHHLSRCFAFRSDVAHLPRQEGLHGRGPGSPSKTVRSWS